MKRLNILSLLVLLGAIALAAMTYINQVAILDTVKPEISMDSDTLTVSIHDAESTYLTGVTAKDNRDGDVTDSLVIESVSSFVEKNTRIISYAAFDKSDNIAKATRKLVYSDYSPIRISLSEPLRFATTTNYNLDILKEVKAQDCLEGDISEKVTMKADSDVSFDVAGNYAITLQVRNNIGDQEEYPVTVTFYDQAMENQSPKFTLSRYLIYMSPGETIDPFSYLESVRVGNVDYEITDGTGTYGIDTTEMEKEERDAFAKQTPAINRKYIEITDGTDSSTPGTYEVTYRMQDTDGNVGSVRLIVIVEEV